MEKFKLWCVNAWDWVASPFRKFSAWAGGPSEKRNLIGWGIDLTWGLVTLPFKAVWYTGAFIIKAFKDPAAAFEQLQFQAGRLGKAFGSLLHLYRVDPYTGRRRMDLDRVLLIAWAWILGSLFATVLGPVGGWLILACFVGFVASGLPAAKVTWKETTFADWKAQRRERIQESRVTSAEARISTAENVANLAEREAELARRWADVQAAQARAMQMAKDAELMIEEAKNSANAHLLEGK